MASLVQKQIPCMLPPVCTLASLAPSSSQARAVCSSQNPAGTCVWSLGAKELPVHMRPFLASVALQHPTPPLRLEFTSFLPLPSPLPLRRAKVADRSTCLVFKGVQCFISVQSSLYSLNPQGPLFLFLYDNGGGR